MVSSSGVCPRRSDALDSPSVTYGPNRPSLITIGFSVSGSAPISRSGGAAARRCRAFGAASSASASSSVTVNSLLLAVQRAEVVAPLDVRAVAAVGRDDLGAVRRPCRPRGAASAAAARRSSVSVSGRLRLEQRRLALAARHVRAEAAGLEHDRLAGLRVVAELRSPPPPRNSSSTFSGVSSSGAMPSGIDDPVARSRSSVDVRQLPLQVRPVPADPDHDVAALVVGEQRDRVDAAGVDVAEVLGDHLLQAAGRGDRVVRRPASLPK